ncbi:hypothetical protein NDU88_002573 [Pleurodeles waltl]|uniref:Uncharacterized protein n=1 Tax=Pleurodeles waltl TaxID=8319 RepID=A0AAV7MN66_PLEWA|nr:hypothetical protein NDU88_002573 [Pleurodeles waltl]
MRRNRKLAPHLARHQEQQAKRGDAQRSRGVLRREAQRLCRGGPCSLNCSSGSNPADSRGSGPTGCGLRGGGALPPTASPLHPCIPAVVQVPRGPEYGPQPQPYQQPSGNTILVDKDKKWGIARPHNQNVREGARANPSAERESEEAEPLSEQTAAQARQARLEGRDSIVRFLRRKATGSPEWGRKHVRSHAAEEEADSRTSTEEQIPTQGTSSPDISTDTDSPTEGIRAHRSLSCPALLTTGHHDLAEYDDSLSQARAAPLAPLTTVFSIIADTAFQCFNSTADCLLPVVSPQPSLYKDLFATADTANKHANKSEEHKPATNNVTTIAQVIGKFEWFPRASGTSGTSRADGDSQPPELSPCGKSTILPIAKGRSSNSDQELGALSKQFLNNLEEQINRTLSLTTTVTAVTATKHYEKEEDGDSPSVITTHECPTNAQELPAIRASQDIMASILICQSNKMEPQLDLFQSLDYISAGCQNKDN